MGRADGRRVLVVEDETMIAMHLADLLGGAGHRVLGPVPTLAEALEFILDGAVDAALLDINLGDRTSAHIADALKQRAIPFAFVTAYSPDLLPERHRGHAVLAKPIDEPRLLATVAAMLDGGARPAGR